MSEAKFTPHYLLENLRDVYFAERTGTLTLQRGGGWRRLYFERGMLALADSYLEAETLGAVLAELQALPAGEEPVDRSVDVLEQARAWRESGRVEPAMLERCARECVQRVVDGAFRWDGGTFRFDEGEVVPPVFLPDVLFTFEVFQRGVQEMENFLPLKEVMLAEERRLRLNEGAFLPIQSLSLGPEQGYILSRLDGSLRPRDVVAVAPEGNEERVLRMLFGFLVLGIVLFDPAPGEGIFSLRDLMEGHRDERQREREERERVLAAFEATRGKSSRQVLGLGDEAGPDEVKRAYDSLRDRFRRDRFAERVRSELKRELGMIENRLLEAYLHLQSEAIEKLTPRHREGSDPAAAFDFEKRKELVKSEAQESAEEQHKQAERYFLKAKDYFREGDFFNCIQFCKLAVKFNPNEAPFFSLMADALLKNPDHRWQRLAEESYRKAVEIDPWNADYLVSLGQLYKQQGLLRRARRHFEKALEILPRHVRAREELDAL
jgi:tetratricopeptide (TPR) repeat protein